MSVSKLGIGDWGLGIGDWGLGPIPNPQSPIPHPQSPKNDEVVSNNQRKNLNKIIIQTSLNNKNEYIKSNKNKK